MATAKPIPKGFHTITPSLVVRGGARAIDFYKRAFGATERMRMDWPDGKGIMHAELDIGDSCFFLADENPGMGCQSPASLGGCTGGLHLYVDDVDAAMQRAADAGATVKMPAADMFWGDRYGQIADPFGHLWGLATHVEDLTPEQMCQRARDFLATSAAGK